MGNHPQLGAALSNVADLNRIYLAHQRETARQAEEEDRAAAAAARRASKEAKRSKPAKKKEKKEKKKKARDEKKGKKEKKERRDKTEKKDKKARRKEKKDSVGQPQQPQRGRSDDSSDSDTSDSSSATSDSWRDAGPPLSHATCGRRSAGGASRARIMKDELKRGQAAAEAARQILAKFPNARGDLRGLLRTVDDGEAVAIDGIPDERLRMLLGHLFDRLGLEKSAATGAHILPRRAPRTAVQLALIFDMSDEQLAPFARARSPWREPEPPHPERSSGPPSTGAGGRAGGEEEEAARGDALEGRVMTGEEADALLGSEEDDSGEEDGGEARRQKGGDLLGRAHAGVRRKGPPSGSAPVGATVPDLADDVADPPDDVAAFVAAPNPSSPDSASRPARPIGPDTRPPPKRVLGPMAPPRSMLEAAAAEMAADAVGPAPPEIAREVELTGAEAREAAAARVLQTVAAAGDAYDVLNVAPEDEAGPVKRAFWKLSLMVHPDKCDHPRAAEAFDAVKKAHVTLTDPSQRAVVDASRANRKDREGFEAWLAEERRQAQWRKIQGNPLPGDDELLNGPRQAEGDKAEGGREEWMTSLPAQMRPKAGGHTTSVSSFAATTFVERDAATVADWTDTPADAATREARLFLAAQERRYALPAVQAAAAAKASKEHESLVDDFNERRRPKTLLEQHQERQERAAKSERGRAKRRKTKGAAGEEKDGDGTGWEYRPWNRDTDLEAGRTASALKPEDMLKKAGGDLKGRFGGGSKGEGGGRTFL